MCDGIFKKWLDFYFENTGLNLDTTLQVEVHGITHIYTYGYVYKQLLKAHVVQQAETILVLTTLDRDKEAIHCFFVRMTVKLQQPYVL